MFPALCKRRVGCKSRDLQVQELPGGCSHRDLQRQSRQDTTPGHYSRDLLLVEHLKETAFGLPHVARFLCLVFVFCLCFGVEIHFVLGQPIQDRRMNTKNKGMYLLFLPQLWSSLSTARLFDTWAVLQRLFQSLWRVKLAEGLCKALLTMIHMGFLRSLLCLSLLLFAGRIVNFAKSIYRQYRVVNPDKHFKNASLQAVI